METDLRRALLDANLRQFQELMEQAAEPDFTPRYRKDCIRMIASPNDWARRFGRPLWKKVVQAAACILLACTLALGALMGISPTVRAAVKNWFRELSGDAIVYQTTVHGQSAASAAFYRPTALPQNWVVNRMQSDGYDCQWHYRNGDAWMMFRCIGPTPAEEQNGPGASKAEIHTPDDLLQSSRQTISIQGCSADFYQEGERALLTWENEEGLLFWLCAEGVTQEELVEIAQQIRCYQGTLWRVQTDWLPEGYQLNEAGVAALGDSGQLEWRQERNVITCVYSGTTPLRLPDGTAERVSIHGTEGRFWAGSNQAQGPTLIVDGQAVAETSVAVSGNCTVSVGGGSAENRTLSWTDPDTGISVCLSGPADREDLLQIAEHLHFTPAS